MQSTLKLPQNKPVGKPVWIVRDEVKECSVSLQFWSDNLVPDDVTNLLGINPTRSYKKGDVFRCQVNEQVHKFGLWLYSVNRCGGVSLEDQINALFDQLPADIGVWWELKTKFEANLFFRLPLEQSSSVLDFSQQTLQRISERGLSIGLDLYFYDYEKESDL